MRFAIATLGCKINQYESEWLREALINSGAEEQPFEAAAADLYIINSCIVTQRSAAENRKLARKALDWGGRVILTGCQAKALSDDLGDVAEGVEIVAADALAEHLGIESLRLVRQFAGHRRAFVKVQSGCDNFCSYCIVPFARGLPVSRPVGEIIDEINALQIAGFREVVLCGINIGLYEGGLATLMRDLLAATEIPRLRISSIEPWTLNDDFMRLFAAEPRICRHLHLPLQSGSDEILAAMRRPYRRDYYRAQLQALKAIDPLMAIGTDVMVGFPGETDDQFADGLAFIESLPLTYLHVFPYSRRPGTVAAGLVGQVPEIVKKRRARQLRQISVSKRLGFEQSCLGMETELLVTGGDSGVSWGPTSNYLNVKVEAAIARYETRRIRVIERRDEVLWGEVLP